MDRRSSIWLKNSLDSGERKLKRGFLWVLRSARSSETICSTTYFRVMRKKLHFIWCQLTSSGISGQNITRNWLRTCQCITKLVAICPERYTCFIPTWISSPTTAAWLVMSTVNVFIRKLQRRRNDIRESGPLPSWLTTVGWSPKMLLSSCTNDRQSKVASRSGLLSLNVWCTYFLNR